MGKWKKWILRLVLVALLGVVLLVVSVFIWINQIAKIAVEKGATYALGVDTKLGNASIGIFSGKFLLESLDVANPQGYKTKHFLDLKKASLEVPVMQLLGDNVTIERLEISGLDMNLEKKSDGTANYEVIMANLKKLEAQNKDDKKDPQNKPDKPAKKYLIKKIVIKDVVVHADITPIGGGVLPPIDVVVPPIELDNRGSDKTMTMDEITDLIIKTTLTSAVANAGGSLGSIGDDLGKGLKDLSSLSEGGIKVIGDLGKNLGDGLKNVGDGAGKVLNDLGKGLGNPFGNDDKDKKK